MDSVRQGASYVKQPPSLISPQTEGNKASVFQRSLEIETPQITRIISPRANGWEETDVARVFFRFWGYNKLGSVSDKALAIRSTPHYGLAKKALEVLTKKGSVDEIKSSVEYCRYQAYAQHEANSSSTKLHDGECFLGLISTFYEREFDLSSHPIEVSEFAKSANGESIFYILDGSHRAAYAAAHNDILEQSKKVCISICPGISHWPDVKAIGFGSSIVKVD